MKLKFTATEVERSSTFQSTQFDIGDKRIIMEILRSKMYSNPIQSICQEISTNARDAHIEVGKSNEPVEIKLPNKLEPFFYVKDFGPGISPDRINTIYVFYCKSTKRDDNEEDGAYGLGSKTPFSYTDTFTVISTTPDENGTLIRREYLAHIDESGLGQMSLVKEEETTEPQGTTVQFYVEEKDFASFGAHVKRACTHWKVRPTIKGDPSWKWPLIKEVYTGNKWTVHEISPLEQRLYALINGIPYNLNLRHIFSNDVPTLYQNLDKIPLRLLFDIGEIPVTANREEIDYQDHAIAYLRKRVEESVRDLQGALVKKLAACNSLRKAVIFWQELRKSTYGCLLALTKWRDFKLAEYQNIRIPANLGVTATNYKATNDSRYGHKKKSGLSGIALSSSILLVEDDIKTKGVARSRLATLFQERGAHQVILVDFLKKEVKRTAEDGTTYIDIDYVDEETIKARKKSINWDLLDPIKISDIPKRALAPSTRVRNKTIKIKLFSGAGWQPIPENFQFPPIKFYVETASKSVILSKYPNKAITRSLNDVPYLLRQLDSVLNIGKTDSDKLVTQLFGVIPSQVAKLDKTWYPLNTYAGEVLKSFKKKIPKDYGDQSEGAQRKLGRDFYALLNKDTFQKRLASSSLFHEYLLKSKEAEETYKLISIYNNLSSKFGHGILGRISSNTILQKLYAEIIKRYPLIKSLHSLYNPSTEVIDDIIEYVNLKDQKFASSVKEKPNERI